MRAFASRRWLGILEPGIDVEKELVDAEGLGSGLRLLQLPGRQEAHPAPETLGSAIRQGEVGSVAAYDCDP